MAAWDSVPNAGAGGADDRQKAWMNKKKLAANVVSPPEEKKMCSGGLAGRGNLRCGLLSRCHALIVRNFETR